MASRILASKDRPVSLDSLLGWVEGLKELFRLHRVSPKNLEEFDRNCDTLKEVLEMASEAEETLVSFENTDLRDRFAEAALTGLLTSSDTSPEAAAAQAYEQADAMLEARKRKEPGQ